MKPKTAPKKETTPDALVKKSAGIELAEDELDRVAGGKIIIIKTEVDATPKKQA